MKKIETVTCQTVMEHICESLNEDLDSDKCQVIREHIEKCDNCSNYYKSIEMTIDFYRKYNLELPEDSHKKLMDLLNLEDEDES